MLRYACSAVYSEKWSILHPSMQENNWLNVLFCQESAIMIFYFIKCQIILWIGCSVSTSKYVDLSDILKSDWLPVKHNMNWNLCKLAYKALNCEKWPPYLPLEVCVYQRTLRSSLVLNLVVLQFSSTTTCTTGLWNLSRLCSISV